MQTLEVGVVIGFGTGATIPIFLGSGQGNTFF